MDYLLTSETVLKEISALAWNVKAKVRYDGTLPFRAAVHEQRCIGWGQMPRRRSYLSVTERAARFLSQVIFASALLGSTPTYADNLNSAYFLAMQPYAVLKRVSIACDGPVEQHVNYKQRMLRILRGVPDVDIRAASLDIEKAYKIDADLGGLKCTNELKDRYRQLIDRGVDQELEKLEEQVRNRQKS